MLLTQNINNQDGQPAQQMEGGETFFQRMKRLTGEQQAANAGVPVQGQQVSPYQGQTAAQPTSPQSSSSPTGQNIASVQMPAGQAGTPVQGDGKIPPPSAPAPQVGQTLAGANPPVGDVKPGPTQVAPQGGTDPFAAMGGGVRLPTGEWVPKNHPLAQSGGQIPQVPGLQPAPGMGVNGPQNLGPTNLGNTPFSTYTGSTFNTATPEGYTADQFSQFTRPDQAAGNAGIANLMQAILGNPESMGADTVNAMKNSAKETALLQAKQAAMRAQNNAAARGTAGGGFAGALDRRINDAASSEILRNNRDVDIAAAQTNFRDRLNALSAGDSVLNNQMGREATAFDSLLRGQTAQAGANQAAADSRFRTADFGLRREGMQADENFRGFDSRRGAEDRGLQRQIAQADIDRAIAGHNSGNYFSGRDADRGDRALDLQGELGRGGLSLDRDRLNSANDQFGKNFGLNIMQFLEGRRQADNGMGFNWAQLNQNGQQSMMDNILRLVGGR
jgi:hypothetical protein